MLCSGFRFSLIQMRKGDNIQAVDSRTMKEAGTESSNDKVMQGIYSRHCKIENER
jgi:hypothetical protein